MGFNSIGVRDAHPEQVRTRRSKRGSSRRVRFDPKHPPRPDFPQNPRVQHGQVATAYSINAEGAQIKSRLVRLLKPHKQHTQASVGFRCRVQFPTPSCRQLQPRQPSLKGLQRGPKVLLRFFSATLSFMLVIESLMLFLPNVTSLLIRKTSHGARAAGESAGV